ncbi:AEC family transporter [Alkalicoccus urumqiensis]|uniref:AEC family transporter n=1 Tax=Alkalicoccus urumqiensis TaxID=1548213 RepID=A0A2P6MHV5_ALKUR|nr:AEC family transporter [Alkalicoccus urumqiensis]PRO65856.1 hypothetical protein C6I21_08140 [Alkalicoccus urumqiensis]
MAFISVILPIFIVFAVGFLGQRLFAFDTRELSTMALFLISPFLVFETFYTNTLSMDYVYLAVYTVVLSGFLLISLQLWGRFKGWKRNETAGVMLSGSFMNNGNYGAPLALFVFGAAGMEIAIILMVFQQLMMSTVGIFIAAKGGAAEKNSISTAFKSVVRMPILYAALLGIALQLAAVELSSSLAEVVSLIAGAAIPVIMIVLGMQLANVPLKRVRYSLLTATVVSRLIVSPVLAFLLVWGMPLEADVKLVMILMAATPTSANITLYALRFRTEPEFVSLATLITTVLTLLTIPIVLWLLPGV